MKIQLTQSVDGLVLWQYIYDSITFDIEEPLYLVMDEVIANTISASATIDLPQLQSDLEAALKKNNLEFSDFKMGFFMEGFANGLMNKFEAKEG